MSQQIQFIETLSLAQSNLQAKNLTIQNIKKNKINFSAIIIPSSIFFINLQLLITLQYILYLNIYFPQQFSIIRTYRGCFSIFILKYSDDDFTTIYLIIEISLIDQECVYFWGRGFEFCCQQSFDCTCQISRECQTSHNQFIFYYFSIKLQGLATLQLVMLNLFFLSIQYISKTSANHLHCVFSQQLSITIRETNFIQINAVITNLNLGSKGKYYYKMSDKEQQKQKPKITLNKSSIDLSDNQSQNQNQRQSQKSLRQTQLDQNMDNLLDLDESFVERKKKYENFINEREIVIEGPQLVTENVIKSYKLYSIKSKKKDSSEYDTCVSRRFSDFQYLQKQLFEAYGGCIIPLLPEKNIWANVNMEGQQEIVNRVKGLQKYLRSLMSHNKLRLSEEVRNFLFDNQIKFSQKKGDYFSKVKTQQKIKQLASNAYSIGKGIFYNFFHNSQPQQQQQTHILKPTIEDVRLMEYQRQVSDLIKVINVLRKVVESSVLEMKSIGLMMIDSKQAQFESMSILCQFQDLCKYIFSCNEALARRHRVRIQMDQLNIQYENLQRKIKSNPRSQEVDLLRNKVAKSIEKCQKWTSCLLQQLQESISMGKSMIEEFINYYTERKGQFYDL